MERNLTIYNDNMRKSMMDKIFFIDKVESDIIVDFGCADGSMINLMNDIFPQKLYYGYDHNEKMIELSKQNNTGDNCLFFSDWSKLLETIRIARIVNKNKVKICIVFSSVLHEIDNKLEFFDVIDLSVFDYVVIREMFFEYDRHFTLRQMNDIIKHIQPEIIDYYGSKIYEDKNIVQSMFKSYYKENLKLELLEDYFSFDNTAMNYIERKFKLKSLYKEKFILPYWRETIIRDFGIDLSVLTTHIKLIYEVNKL